MSKSKSERHAYETTEKLTISEVNKLLREPKFCDRTMAIEYENSF